MPKERTAWCRLNHVDKLQEAHCEECLVGRRVDYALLFTIQRRVRASAGCKLVSRCGCGGSDHEGPCGNDVSICPRDLSRLKHCREKRRPVRRERTCRIEWLSLCLL